MSDELLKEILESQQLIIKTLQQHGEQLQSLNQRIGGLEQGQQELKTSVQKVESKVDKLELRLENEAFNKIGALFDGFSLRGDQIENLRRHIDERLDSIETDTRYLVARVARLEKLAK